MNLRLRKATFGDCDDLFQWRNDPETRRQVIHNERVPYKAHRSWLKETLASDNRVLFVAEIKKGIPVGTCRIDYQVLLDADLHYGPSAELSWTVAPKWRGKGIGEAMLTHLFKRPELEGIQCMASIKSGNKASIRLAEKLKMKKQNRDGDLILFVLKNK